MRAQKLLLDSASRALSPDPRRAAGDLQGAGELLVQLARTRPSAPMTPLNAGLGPNRRFALHERAARRSQGRGQGAGGTVNDALLAAVAGMLRRYMEAAGEPVGKPLVALVPVSVRRPGEEGGNRISTVLVDLPVGEQDPAERIVAIHATMAELKDSAAVRAGALLVGATGWAPPLFSSTLARAMGERARLQPRRLQRARAAAAVLAQRLPPARGRTPPSR